MDLFSEKKCRETIKKQSMSIKRNSCNCYSDKDVQGK